MPNDRATLKQALEALERAKDWLYNGFEPDNQCTAYHRVVESIASLRAAVEAPDARDGARYRWLSELWTDHELVAMWHGDALDAAIDAAMKEQK